MKKIIMSTLAIAMMMTMASCSSSDNDVAENITENELKKMTFTAICENSVGTRAKLDSENKVLWEEGDQIGINGYPYTLEEGAGTTKGVFGGSSQQTKYIAVYPYKERWSPSSNFEALNIPFPSEQTATEGTFDKGAALMVAYSDNGSTTLEFKNVGALVKVKPKFNCKKIVLNAGDESFPLAGKGTLSYNGGNPKFTINSEKAYSITLSGNIQSDKTYYIAVPAVKLNAGWNISFVDQSDSYVYTRRGSKEIEFKRNSIIDLGEFYTSTDETPWTSTIQRNGRVGASMLVDLGLTIASESDSKTYKVFFAKSNLVMGGLAAKESDYGDYFAWGSKAPLYNSYSRTNIGTSVSVIATSWQSGRDEGYVWANTPFINDDNSACTQYTDPGSQLASNDDVASFLLLGNWQIPTKDIWVKLHDLENFIWQSTTVDGYKGYKVTSKYNNNSIFLPYAGCFIGNECQYTNSRGHYWSNTAISEIKASYIFSADNNAIYPEGSGSCSRCYGFSIRPVCLVEVNN